MKKEYVQQELQRKIDWDDWYDYPFRVIFIDVGDYSKDYDNWLNAPIGQVLIEISVPTLFMVVALWFWSVYVKQWLYPTLVLYEDGIYRPKWDQNLMFAGTMIAGLASYFLIKTGPIGFYIFHYFEPEVYHNVFGWLFTILTFGFGFIFYLLA